jgi:predicted house-cleaning noncanonical NTP pyrophosphatase (MazG superfamily)
MLIQIPFKLVRDRIPDVINAKGGRSLIRSLEGKAYRDALADKLVEEAREVRNAKDKASITIELGDILDIVEAIRLANMISDNDLNFSRRVKQQKLGMFAKGIKLLASWGGK